MRKVLHVGPAKTPGGMATVMKTLADNPPDGWVSDTIATHIPGSIFAKAWTWIKARRKISKMLVDSLERPDLVHIHSASDWSFRRKASIISLCKKNNIPCILHIHSGKFDSWMKKKSDYGAAKVRKVVDDPRVRVVVLTENWSEKLGPFLGKTLPIYNPILPISPSNGPRNTNKVLLMGRPDPVKGANIAIGAIRLLRSEGLDVTLHLTGVTPGHKWSRVAEDEGAVIAHGWLSELELENLRSEVGLLLVPSSWEGQPMVIIEALARGIPILASSSCAEHVGSAGRIVDSMEIKEWAHQIREIIHDDDARESMSSAGLEIANNHFIDVVNDKWSLLYASLT